MERSFWERVEELRESINGGVEPLEEVRLPTKTVKIALGMFLAQSAVIALWWSISEHAFYPWLLFGSAFLQVGWFWNKVTDSWKFARGIYYQRVYDEETGLHAEDQYDPEPINPPTINIQNAGVTGNQATPSAQPSRANTSAVNTIRHPLQNSDLMGSGPGDLWGTNSSNSITNN